MVLAGSHLFAGTTTCFEPKSPDLSNVISFICFELFAPFFGTLLGGTPPFVSVWGRSSDASTSICRLQPPHRILKFWSMRVLVSSHAAPKPVNGLLQFKVFPLQSSYYPKVGVIKMSNSFRHPKRLFRSHHDVQLILQSSIYQAKSF